MTAEQKKKAAKVWKALSKLRELKKEFADCGGDVSTFDVPCPNPNEVRNSEGKCVKEVDENA
jgi:hypothetical protein